MRPQNYIIKKMKIFTTKDWKCAQNKSVHYIMVSRHVEVYIFTYEVKLPYTCLCFVLKHVNK